ncbi:hypothetical protein GCM10011351_14620 [Paraliobacillus quinghaiensis]|uniref:EfeO-type cupredoxin-like domain-containing protein n=1 Tax=Paraliobacillus quinghaiensis TaxID=470815 RepID=A0A917TNK3_9BACI|nr:cupredoxin domain-containing protein [Paraliobacillus quinghaiensis]GGM29591.1 hypothetical protein GCM10011351_14620 [Paraliobacillus quinghaiensis]
MLNILKKYKLELILLTVVVGAIIPITLNFVAAGEQDSTIGKSVEISMSGYNPSTINANVGEEITIKLINPDNSAHLDGGGWHQFASDELDFDYRLSPKSTEVITLKVNKPGEYEFYCDICCGGRENPSMQGKLIIS